MTQMIIDAPEVERADGTHRCIGYGVDSDGRVVTRFAFPSGFEWDAPNAVSSIEYVDSMDNLPPKDDHYQTDQL